MIDRIIHIIILMLAAAFSAHAQLEVKVGYTGSTHRLEVDGTVEKVHADGMTAGVTYDISLAKNLYLRPGLMYGFEWYSETSNQTTEYGGFSINEHFKNTASPFLCTSGMRSKSYLKSSAALSQPDHQ